MPRPKVDIDGIREDLLVAAERRLRRFGSPRFSMTELAADCRMSQSNVYRFFPNKAALMAALVERWFADIEEELGKRVSAAQSWQAKLHAFVRVQLDIKSARFDADPDLFRAYLALAEEQPDPVAVHVTRLQQTLDGILAGVGAGSNQAQARALVEDATQLFRDPFLIARFRARCSPARADTVVEAVVAALEGSFQKASK